MGLELKEHTEPLLCCSQIFQQSCINTKKVNGCLQHCCIKVFMLCVSVCAGIVLPVCIRGRALYLGLSVIF